MNPTTSHIGLEIFNPNYYSFTAQAVDGLTIDVLGGVDMAVVERMYCTLRICYQSHPPIRHTLDLYADNHTDELIRKLCTQFELHINDASKAIYQLTQELEDYRLKQMRIYDPKVHQRIKRFTPNEREIAEAKKALKDKNLLKNIKQDFKELGIHSDSKVALSMYLSMASFAYSNPFSVLCMAEKGGISSSLISQLATCLPEDSYSVHTHISDNALYYFENQDIHNKTLLIEDLEWTENMLRPLKTLQAQGRLIKTRATKDKFGHIHSTSFEVTGKLCLAAFAYTSNDRPKQCFPFLTLFFQQSQDYQTQMMKYQQKLKSGQIDHVKQHHIKQHLKTMVSQLNNIRIINPYAPLIKIPNEIGNPLETLSLVLDFIEIITYFHQHQREVHIDEQTGEEYILTHPKDIEIALELLQDSLFQGVDELTRASREFLTWLQAFTDENNLEEFTTQDIRAKKKLHPRSLRRYLQELTAFQYVEITGGNRYREGYTFKILDVEEDLSNERISKKLKLVIDAVWKQHKASK